MPFAFSHLSYRIYESRCVMELKRGKNIVFTVICGMFLLIVRMILNISYSFMVPYKVQIILGVFFLTYGLALAFWEIRNNLPLFWGAGSSLFNIGAINSSMIIGASIFFFASNAVHGLCAFGVEVALYALISVLEWK